MNGGEETPVLEFPEVGYWGYWAVAEKGIYFVSTDARPYAIEFFDFATRRVVHVASLEKAPVDLSPGWPFPQTGEQFSTCSRIR